MSEYFAVMLMVTFPKMKQASRIPKPENVDIPVIQNKIIIRQNVKFSEEERAESSTLESSVDHYVTMNYLVMTPQQHLRCHRHLRYHNLNKLEVQQESETLHVTVEGKKQICLCQLNPWNTN